MFACWWPIALMSADRQTDRQTDRKADWRTYRQAERHTYRQTDRLTDRQYLFLNKTGLFHHCWASPAAIGQILSKLSYSPKLFTTGWVPHFWKDSFFFFIFIFFQGNSLDGLPRLVYKLTYEYSNGNSKYEPSIYLHLHLLDMIQWNMDKKFQKPFPIFF